MEQPCWLGSVNPITWFKYANEDELTCLLPVTPSRLAKGKRKFTMMTACSKNQNKT
ncbi:conserved hypothetical protein [Vibrio cholerae RC385]|nr:conserved hypothetical protein [Vibrio cholerae RC385]